MDFGEMYWIEDNTSFYDICSHSNVIHWKGKYSDDLYDLSCYYFKFAYDVVDNIINNYDDNIKCDMWFLPAAFMFRQSMELLMKALLAKKIKKNFHGLLTEYKHDLEGMFKCYTNISKDWEITMQERRWLCDYLHNLEIVDKMSTLFRYPFKDEFLNQYNNDFLDICDMGNAFLNAYTILKKEYTGIEDKDIIEINTSMNTSFLIFANHGIGNCQIYEFPWGDGFHKQIIGYRDVSEFIWKSDHTSDIKLFPMMFLLRNAIELALKRLLFVKVEQRVDDKKVRKTKNSHDLKELWEAVYPMLEYYSKGRNEDLKCLRLAEKYILELYYIDKKGDAFKYPFNYNLQYRFNDLELDIDNIYKWLTGIFNFLDSCSYMLDDVADYEAEIYSSIW